MLVEKWKKHWRNENFHFITADMTDQNSLYRALRTAEPDEVYNLAAQSHVQVSFETAEYTANADALGTLRLLEAIRILGLTKKTKNIKMLLIVLKIAILKL